jgi:hypothetical protein
MYHVRHPFISLTIAVLITFTLSMERSAACVHSDSLTEINVSGSVIIDSSALHFNYYLSTDMDSIAEYKLNFGPFWYQPDSSDAVRPADGEVVSIFGGLTSCDNDSCLDSCSVIIVYEINDLYWRDPYEPYWNRLGQHRHRFEYSYRNHTGFAFGWLNRDIEVVTIDGIVLVDSTLHFSHYYLDVDEDTLPDYFLNFGPPWYEPESGLSKPAADESVTITGAVVDKNFIPVLFVYEINGEAWLDSTGLAPGFGGAWLYRHMNQNRFIHTAFDTLNRIQIHAGWDNQEAFPESLFCRMLQLSPQNIPYAQYQNMFSGFEIGLFNKAQNNLMVKNDSTGDMIQLSSEIQYRFHYYESQDSNLAQNENRIQVKVWNRLNQQWENIDDIELNSEKNLISFSSTTLYSLIILTTESASTQISEENTAIPAQFILNQNYPNPFNPVTTVEFAIPFNTRIQLTLYNILGQEVLKIKDGYYRAGIHRVTFSMTGLSSGVYFYQLKAGDMKIVQKLTYIK